jgi:DNA invertase Pin-like site-specific DNA recombinase
MNRIGAAYLRTSMGTSDETRQRDEIGKWADRTKNTIDREFLDKGGKRHQSEKREQWQAMMALVKQDKVAWIVVEEHTRFGYADTYEFYEMMAELRRHKTILYEARTGRVLNPHPNEMGGIITSSVQSVQSHQETSNLAARALKAKLIKAEQGVWGGGPIPYAMAVACRTKTGETLWTAEQVGDSFEQHYLNGNSRILGYFPTDREEKTEFLYLVPSRYQDRIEAVRYIFQWVQDDPGIALSEITRRLIKQGHRPASGGVFRYTLVHSILGQPSGVRRGQEIPEELCSA